jgi:hypothetical protein
MGHLQRMFIYFVSVYKYTEIVMNTDRAIPLVCDIALAHYGNKSVYSI